MSDIEKLLQQSDKAEFLEWVQANLPEAEKCLVAVAKPDGEGGLVLATCQVGHKYMYELTGFVEWVMRFVEASGRGDSEEDEE